MIGTLRAIVLVVSATGLASSAGSHPRQNATQVAQAQQVEDLAEWNRLAPYLRIVAAYRAGRVNEAVRDILAWPRSGLDEALRSIRRLRHRLVLCREATPAIDGRTFAGEIEIADLDAAVLLHTDAALRALEKENSFGAQTQFRAALPLFDWTRAVTKDWPRDPIHLPIGCRPLPDLEPRDWSLASSWSLLLFWELDLADTFAGRGLDAARDDPEMLLAAATIKEGMAIDATQFPRVASRLPARVRDMSGRPARRDERQSLGDALALYQRALGVEPVYIQTRLRLGRVLSQVGRLDEARAELEMVAASADENPERYLAELFLARVEEQAEDPDAAIARYRRALDAWPESQAARVGLVHALGRADGGARPPPQLGELLARPWPRPIDFDPWWVYPFGECVRGFRLLDELRRRFVVTP